METAVVATETNDLDWLSKMIIDMEQNLQSGQDNIEIIDTQIEEYVENIDKIYDKDGANKLMVNH